MPRPREFDPDETIDQAMRVFWRKGYLGTSLQDLVDETGVNRASLYATFEDKHTLFLKALTRYRDVVVPGRVDILLRPGAGLAEIREYFEAVVEDLVGPSCGLGCLMVNSATELAAHDPEVADAVAAHLAGLEGAFAHALAGDAATRDRALAGDAATRDRAVADARSDAAATPDPDDHAQRARHARFLTSAAQGLMVVGKAAPDREVLRDIVDSTMEALR